MAGTFTPTGSYSNLTRLELEQLRKADFFAGSKALTVGDSALAPEGVVGKGDINAEPYLTGPSTLLDDVYALTPPQQPGPGISTLTQLQTVPSETVKWYGPTPVQDGTSGSATGASTWQDLSGVNFTLLVQANDILLIKPKTAPTDLNAYCSATVSVVAATTLTLTNIYNPTNGVTTQLSTLSAGADLFEYVIIRPNAVQLFAVPGSGSTGFEQTFLMVAPGSTLHNAVAPTVDQINADRIKFIVPASYALNSTVDRSDAVYGPPNTGGPRLGLDQLGYRVILYPDNGAGTGPDLTKPITAVNPVISTSIPIGDQRMTIDYKAGIVRLSCEPSIGGQIKVTGGVNGTTGRLNLYAVFWAVDTSLTAGLARGLYGLRSTNQAGLTPGKVVFDTTHNAWRLGATTGQNAFYVRAPDALEDSTLKTEFGAIDTSVATSPYRYLAYRSLAGRNNVFTMLRQPTTDSNDDPSFYEVVIADKTEMTLGDGSNPAQSPGGDLTPVGTGVGQRLPQVEEALIGQYASRGATGLAVKGYGTLHLRRGLYDFSFRTQPIVIPPGITVEGEGDLTVVRGYGSSIFKSGPNTPWGVWDIDWEPDTSALQTPPSFDFTTNERLEGIDIVWNPIRRVWGVVHADTTLNAIFFNEIRPDGTKVLPGLGVNLKDSAQNLYTISSPRGSLHTSSHYPRIAHAPYTDKYMVVWVEENVGVTGPQVMMQSIGPSSLNPLTFSFGMANAQALLATDGTHALYSDHPSVAADPSSTSVFAVSYWAHGTGGEAAVVDVISYIGSVLLETVTVTHGIGPVSSTDVASDANSNFVMVWSEQAHPLVSGVNGTLNASSQLTDPSVLDWTTLGLQLTSSQFLHLGKTGLTNADYGKTGYINDNPIVAGSITVYKGIDGNKYPADAGGVQWAFAPACTLRGIVISHTAPFVWVPGSAIDYTRGDVLPAANHYLQTPRELDYVRLSYGDGQFLLVFQAFNTTSYLAKDSNTTFDGGINASFPEAALPSPYQITLQSRGIYRHHISTCAVILGPNGAIVDKIVPAPNSIYDLNSVAGGGPTFEAAASNDIFNSNLSLGTRAPSQGFNNYQADAGGIAGSQDSPRNSAFGFVLEISPRNFFYKWGVAGTLAGPTSIIPDVTWSGTDWVVVSPVQNRIHSDTGFYWTNGGITYFSDASFYFGSGASNGIDGNYLRQTIPTGSQIYIPSATVGSQYQTFTVTDEHTIQLSGAVAGLVANTQYEWYLVMPDTVLGTQQGGIKNPGYRVSPNGRVIIASAYTTFADDNGDSASMTIPQEDETIRKARTAIVNGNTGDAQATDALSPAYGTSRIKYDVGFQGVAVGAPKGICELVNDEHPMCAIAWGENFYGFLDRHVSGLSGGTRVNQTLFYRQSFGPFRNGIRNIRLEQIENSSTSVLSVKTRYSVFTRHDAPASSTGHFATDGYRNFFVTANVRSVTIAQSHRDTADYKFGLDVHTTDALGRHAIRTAYMQASGVAGITGTSLYQFMSDLRSGTDAVNPNQFCPLSPGKPLVIWNGQRPVAFYTITDAMLGTSRNVYIAMVSLPGDEDTTRTTFELNRTLFDGTIQEIARISCGTGDITAAPADQPEPTVQIAAAYSGRTYAVLWCAGLNQGTATTLGHNVVGVSIFHGDSTGGGGAATYVIDNSYDTAHHGNFSHPQILWDGHQFVATWVRDTTPYGAGNRSVVTVGIPELGFGSNPQLKVVGTKNMTATAQGLDYIGTATDDFGGSTDRIKLLDGSLTNSLAVQPGDIIHVIRANDGTNERPALCGSLQVVDVQVQIGVVYAYVQTVVPTSGGYGAGTLTGTTYLYGYVESGGMSSGLLGLTVLGRAGNGVSSTASALTQNDAYFSPSGTDADVCYLGGFAYDEVSDLYTVLMHSQTATPTSTFIAVQQFRMGGTVTSPWVHVATTTNVTPASALGWNGRHYLVVYTDINNALLYVLLSEKLQVVETGTIDSGTAIGYTATAKPGPLYSGTAPGTAGNVKAQLRNIDVKWNGKLNRWVISGSYLWSTDTAFAITTNEIDFAHISNLNNGNNVTAYTGNTLTMASAVNNTSIQPGVRLQFYDNASRLRQTTMTVMYYGGGGTFTVDVGSAETTHQSTIATTHTSFATVVPREDVFVWTLGYNYPVVQFQDADETFLDNVTISGPVDIEEKYLTMAAPSWQAAGIPQGLFASMTQRHGAYYNHMLLSPYGKTATLQLTNVKSRARAKYGR